MRLELLPHQTMMHDHLVAHDRAGCFAGIGLGKTAATLAAFRTNVADGCAKAALIIAPMRVANLTWPNEIAKWNDFKGFKVERLRDVNDRPSGKAQIYLTSYDRLMRTETVRDAAGNKSYVSKLRYTDFSFADTIIFDELTRAKNHTSERINSIRPLLTTHLRW